MPRPSERQHSFPGCHVQLGTYDELMMHLKQVLPITITVDDDNEQEAQDADDVTLSGSTVPDRAVFRTMLVDA